jgi:hypothetical protein
MMTSNLRSFRLSGVVLGLMVVTAGTLMAQQVPAVRPPLPIRSYKVEVVLSRSQGDKKISNMPFVLYGATGSGSSYARMSLRLGVDVPVGASTVTKGSANSNQTSTESSTSTHADYRNVGTQIDCTVSEPVDGAYPVQINIQDSSIFGADGDTKPGLRLTDPMAFRTFSFGNSLPIKDGQTVEFVSAIDKISGEVLKVTVTLTVVK